ncbi:hypothetical protein [Oceanisphaera psychrotolerans]|nr:hypothetical protein [Oceanisphaera psychrotolerans]
MWSEPRRQYLVASHLALAGGEQGNSGYLFNDVVHDLVFEI